jgi:hypothetical protein
MQKKKDIAEAQRRRGGAEKERAATLPVKTGTQIRETRCYVKRETKNRNERR